MCFQTRRLYRPIKRSSLVVLPLLEFFSGNSALQATLIFKANGGFLAETHLKAVCHPQTG